MSVPNTMPIDERGNFSCDATLFYLLCAARHYGRRPHDDKH